MTLVDEMRLRFTKLLIIIVYSKSRVEARKKVTDEIHDESHTYKTRRFGLGFLKAETFRVSKLTLSPLVQIPYRTLGFRNFELARKTP